MAENKTRSPIRKWISRAFVCWAIGSSLWLANSVRTQGVDPGLLHDDTAVSVITTSETLLFTPTGDMQRSGLVFLCGAGIAAEAYAPLLRPLAEEGYPVKIVRLPFRFAPLEAHKVEACQRAVEAMTASGDIARWVIAGHSLGGALSCRVAQRYPPPLAAMVLVGTTHPKIDDLSGLSLNTRKVYGTNDGVAPIVSIEQNRHLLPEETQWIEIAGANHSQFGHYGHQLMDKPATISRLKQQQLTRAAIREALIFAAQPSIDSGEGVK